MPAQAMERGLLLPTGGPARQERLDHKDEDCRNTRSCALLVFSMPDKVLTAPSSPWSQDISPGVPFLKWGNWSRNRLKDLPGVDTKLPSATARI